MSFSAEINDFVNGFKAGAAVGGDFQDRKLAREKWEFDRAFKERSFNESSARANRALDLRERGMSQTQADREARRAAREAEKAERDRARRSNELIRGEGGSGNGRGREEPPDEWYDEEPAFNTGEGDEYTDEYDESALEVPEVTEERVAFAAGGGAIDIPKTMPPEDEEEDVDAVASEGKADVEPALPTAPAPQPAPSAVAPEAEAVPADPTVNREGKSDPVFKNAANVVRDVMDTMESELGEEGEQQPAAIEVNPSKKSQDRVATTPAATPDEIKAIDAKIDPENKMEPFRKGAARLVDAYNFFIEKGDVEKARKIAAKIIKFHQQASMTRGQLALEALRQGDIPSASKLITDAANEDVPDGVTVSVQPTQSGTVAFKIDKEGQAVQQGELDAQQMWELAAGVADGSQFLKRMAVLAGQGDPTSPGNPQGKGKKRSYRATVREAAEATKQYDSLLKAYEEEVDPERQKELYATLKKAYTAKEKALAAARRGADATGRDLDRLNKDLAAALKAAAGALPPDPNAEETALPGSPDAPLFPEGRSALGNLLATGSFSDNSAAAKPAQPAAEDTKSIDGKTYVKIGGKWFEQN